MFLRFGVHLTRCGIATFTALFVYLSPTCQRAAEDGFAADFGSVSGDGRSFRCCTVGELLQDCDSVSVTVVQEKCDDKRRYVGSDFACGARSMLMRSMLMEDAEMVADVKAYDAAKARLEDGSDELIPLEITERRLKGEPALRIWREHRKLTQEQLAKKARVSRALIAAIETKRKTGSVGTWKKLGAALDVGWELLA